MLNEKANLIGLLCVLFVLYAASTALAQSQSANDSLIEKIYQSETRVRDHIDTKTESIKRDTLKSDDYTTTRKV